MNQMQLYERLKFAPQDLLLKYAQNPSAEVPQFLAMAAMQFQKEMKEGGNQAQPPQGTVKDAIIQQAMQGQMPPQMPQQQPQMPQQQMQPQQPVMQAAHGGLAELHVPDHMFQEHNMAGGGIVAFDEGGYVPHFDGTDGSLVSREPSGLLGRLGLTESNYVRTQRQLADMENRLKNMVPGTGPYEALKQSISDLRSENRSKYMNQPSIFKKFSTDQDIPVSDVSTAPSTDYSKTGAYSQDTSLGAKGLLQQPTQTAAPSGPRGPAAPVAPNTPAAPAGPAAPSVNIPQFNMTMQDFAGAEPTKKQSIEDYKEFQNAFGVNDKLYEKQRARQDEQAADIEKQKSTAGWLALANAGFAAAASPSPFFLQGIATGGIKGLTEYNTAMEKLQDRQDKLDAARFNLDDAENKFKQSGSTAALGDYRDALKAHKTAQQKYIEVKTNADFKGAEIATQARGQDLTYKAAMDSHRTMLEQAKIYSQGGAKNTDRILDNLKDLNDPKRYENVMRDAALPNPGNNPVLAKKIADAKQVLAERQELINFNKSLLAGSGVGGVKASAGDIPAGYTPIGRDPKTGGIVYQDSNGKQYIQS